MIRAIWVLLGSLAIAQAAAAQDVIPAEFPPDSYAGLQYVDSKGCVFVRVGVDDNVTWVPRLNRQRIHVCGQTPSLQAARVAQATAPVQAIEEPTVTVVNKSPARVASGSVTQRGIAPPKGYRLAWDDDRLNPRRGQGTAAGEAQMNRIWTQDVPRRLVAQAPETVSRAEPAPLIVMPPKAQVVASSKNRPDVTAGAFIQVGVFGQASNANRAAARLQALGMPVSLQTLRRNGQVLQVVLAGPLRKPGPALSTLRESGFSDAFLRAF